MASKKLAKVREAMQSEGIEAFVVPTDDPHMSEYAHPHFSRREWLSGFTGSAGLCIITQNEALLWTDGRYFLQAEKELGSSWTLMKAGLPDTPTWKDWLASEMGSTRVVGLDPWVHSVQTVTELQEKKLALKMVDGMNPVDIAWGSERPPPPFSQVYAHPPKYAGRTVAEKCEELLAGMAKEGADVVLVTMLDEVAWLLNLRGRDIEFNPLFFSYAMLLPEGVRLYTDPARLEAPEVQQVLAEGGVEVRGYGQVEADLADLAGGGKAIWMDRATVSFKLTQTVEGAVGAGGAARKTQDGDVKQNGAIATGRILYKPSPVAMAKAVKNDAELAGMREAHLRDAAALVQAFCWLEGHITGGGACSEAELADKLIEHRSQQEGFLQPSFPTIAGSGPNGAVIHYRPMPDDCRPITTEEPLLVDSGGQYDCGTTDITRCFHFGTPTARQRQCYTQVLKGHIALASAIWPEGTPGCALDAFARQYLWQAGLNYNHGTGHGVGAALNVHEGPQSISPRFVSPAVPLKVAMIVSNEPGYYEDHAFGFRIENLEEVVPKETPNRFNDKAFLGFTQLTFVPLDTKLMDLGLLTPAEVAWLDSYHARVYERVAPRVQGQAQEWLKAKTAKLGQ